MEPMTPFEISNIVQIVLLSMSLPLSIIAVKGYWGTPWGRVIRPIPVVEVGFIAAQAMSLFEVQSRLALTVTLVLVVVTTLAAVVSGLNLFFLLRGREVPA